MQVLLFIRIDKQISLLLKIKCAEQRLIKCFLKAKMHPPLALPAF